MQYLISFARSICKFHEYLRRIFWSLFFGKIENKTLIESSVTIRNPRNIFLDNCMISQGTYLIPNGPIKIGDNSITGINTVILSGNSVIIGKNVTIGAGCKIYSIEHITLSTQKPINTQGMEYGDVTIEDDVYIGANAVILNNIKIGKGSVIGAGAVVTKNVKPYSIVGGVPAKLIKERNKNR